MLRTMRCCATILLAITANAVAAPPMLRATPEGGFEVTPLISIGEAIDGYRPPGVPDGMAAFAWSEDRLRLFVNHELAARSGYSYRLANGAKLRGSRISYFDIDRRTRRVHAAGLAYGTVFDRAGREVRDAAQISERPDLPLAGFHAFCSAAGFAAGTGGFVDDIMFTHEEASVRGGRHPHGGSVWALDVRNGQLWALPELGRGSWENVAAVATPDGDRPDGHVALLLGDDLEFGAAPLYLWLGRKQPGGSFTARNGLARGQLWAWVADNGDTSPGQWHGSGTMRSGRFVALRNREPERAGRKGYDVAGYPDDTTLRAQAATLGAFLFSRPEDLHTNPRDGREVVFASTGHGHLYPPDDWGGIYLARVRFTAAPDGGWQPAADIHLLYDSDERADHGIRSPDNLVWAVDGSIYVQEDKAVKRGAFAAASGREASIWALHPDRPDKPVRIAEIDRRALPAGAIDRKAAVPGEWESSGIIDVSELLGAWPGELVLLATVQAHGVVDGPIGGSGDLVQAGQLLWLTKKLQVP